MTILAVLFILAVHGTYGQLERQVIQAEEDEVDTLAERLAAQAFGMFDDDDDGDGENSSS